jgi:Dolichyl-phosphate-mannose-protein mannosyltransferase
MRRAMQLLDGLGFQESRSTFSVPYDHPYFGQIFLAGLLALVGYPGSLNPEPGDAYSIETLYLVPRLLMGILAILDTFLVYKIAERRYNRKVAFIAAMLFAVMPMTWMLRRVLLDSILLPFLLSSILFAVYSTTASPSYREIGTTAKWKSLNTKYISGIILSGIFLGIAIFTKIPVFTMIPLVAYLIYTNSNARNKKVKLKTLGLWFIPVILIPFLWPTYALVYGQFDDWLHGVSLQSSGRSVESRSLFAAFNTFFRMDPVLFIVSVAGFIYSAFRRDWYILLWLMPYLLFLYFVGWVVNFHWIAVLPVFCIAAAALIVGAGEGRKNIVRQEMHLDEFVGSPRSMFINKIRTKANRFTRKRILPFHTGDSKIRNKLSIVAVLAIITSGLVSTSILITDNISSSYFELYGFIVERLASNDDSSFNQVAMIGPDWAQSFLWIPRYVFDIDVNFVKFSTPREISGERVLLITDPEFRRELETLNEQILGLHESSPLIAEFKEKTRDYPRDTYPYTNLAEKSGNTGIGNVELKSNFLSSP